ncbi:MAG: glycosyltransferase family 4 protein [Desulfobacterales bacterium]|nr:MAG: glycosyltransferase family 4 protein [Desulfobacterales bacterium]
MNRITDHSAPLKICLLSYRSNPHSGGQGVYVANLSRALMDLGHYVHVISGPPEPNLDDDIPLSRLPGLDLYNPGDLFRTPSFKELSDPINLIEWLGVSTMGFPEPFTFGMRAYRYLLKNNIFKYDIVHDNQCISYGIRAIFQFIPAIATIHHPITIDRALAIKTASSFWKKIKHMRWYSFIGMQKRVIKKFSHIITVSKNAKKDIIKDFKIPQERFRIIPNGINTNLFYPVPEIRREKNRIIVTNSADTPLKGLHYLLKALNAISKTRSVRLTVIGTPKKNGSIEALIRHLGIGRWVTFTGRIDSNEYLRQYARASVAVIPSLYEGFGLPAGEAMACGIPVISTTGGALSEVVGDAGILVPPADHVALAEAITDVLDNPELAQKMGRAGYQRVHQFFTWKRAAEMTVEAYRETIHDYHRF